MNTKKTALLAKLDAGRATAQAIAAPAAQPATWPPKKTKERKPRAVAASADSKPSVPRIQFLVRLTPEARRRVKDAAWKERISEQELIERYALTLPA